MRKRSRSAKPAPRAAETIKRTAQLKPDAAKADVTPDALPDEAGADTIRAIQGELGQRGFGPVPSDGIMRPVTRAAIMAYEHDYRLPLTGEASEALLTRLLLGVPATTEVSGGREVRSPHAEALIKRVQRMLAANGYRPGARRWPPQRGHRDGHPRLRGGPGLGAQRPHIGGSPEPVAGKRCAPEGG